MSIPVDLAAKILFLSDRTCCVCRVKGKPVQIHHIDEDNSNHKIENLATLCLDCHTETQIKGGFHRKLDAEQVRLYRDDWLKIVARDRAVALASLEGEERRASEVKNVEMITTTAEILRENKEYELLAIYYHAWGNPDLRDKYIEKAISERKPVSANTEIFLRSLQGKTELVDSQDIEQEIKRKIEWRDWSQLARLYNQIGRWTDAVKTYCQSITESLEKGEFFPAAYYLKELTEENLHARLFENSLREEKERGELWWQVRCLQELGWDTELADLLIARKEEVEKSGNPLLQMVLYEVLKDDKKYAATHKKVVQAMHEVGGAVGLSISPPENGTSV
jgi:hypothetical protein